MSNNSVYLRILNNINCTQYNVTYVNKNNDSINIKDIELYIFENAIKYMNLNKEINSNENNSTSYIYDICYCKFTYGDGIQMNIYDDKHTKSKYYRDLCVNLVYEFYL